jgi:type I restriction enzyme, S subunit
MNDLPSGWDKLRLGDVAVRTSNVDPSRSPEELFELYSVPSFSTGEPDRLRGEKIKSSKQAVEPDDVLLCKIVPHINRVWTVASRSRQRQIASGKWIVYRTHHSDPRYLRYCLSEASFREQFMATVAGVGGSLMRARPSEVAKIEIPLAPLPEQRQIVTKIDSLSAKSKRARDQLDHVPRLVEKYKQAVSSAAFRGELTHTWREGSEQSGTQTLSKVRSDRKSAELSRRRRAALSNLPRRPPRLPGLPTTWVWACIEELAADDNRAVQSGPFGSSLLHSEFQETGYLVIGMDNVQDGIFSLGSQNRIGDTKFFELERFRARPHDVLVTVMATVGRTCVLPDQVEAAIITKHVYRVTVDKRLVLPHYLMNALRGSEVVLEQMGANVRGQTRPGLNGTIIKSIHIPLAPLDEQVEILRVIDSAFAWIERLAAEATGARKLTDHLDQAILAKAFRGELVPQDPNDEPASVLLERIRAEGQAAIRPLGGGKKRKATRA